jgi:hypothetical protein
MKKAKVSEPEANIIATAVKNAQAFGTGILTACKEEIEDAGYEWTEQSERYVFENFIDK